MTNYDLTKPYITYIEDVLSGKEIAGWFVRKACERAKLWFDRSDIELRYDIIDQKINLVQKIKHKKGLQAGKPFILLPFQQFIFSQIFGWYYTGTDKRVISKALLMMARQTGKTYTASSISLAIALDKDLPSPTVDFIANSAKQSAIAFGHCKDQCTSLDPKGKIFSRYRSEIRIPLTGASINVLSADATKLDGRASYTVADEIHEMKTWSQWEIMASGQGSLKNPLMVGISTAGYHPSEDYPLYTMWSQAKQLLSGITTDDSWFYMIFQLDDDDDWKDPKVWKKAIPTLGIAVDEAFIKGRIQEAINTPSKEVDIKTKNLNMWCQSAETWIPYEKINEVSQKFDYDIFDSSQEYSILGVDLAERSDLCVVSTLINHNDKVYLKAHPFICQTAYNNSPNKELYRQWVKNSYLTLVPTDSIDIDYVIKLVQDLNEKIPIALIAYDPWASQQFKIAAEKQGLPMRACKQGLGSFSEPTSMLEHMILTKEVIIDYNPVTNFCFANVLIKTDENSNRKPVKSAKNQKIDIVIAFIQSIKLWMELEGLISDEPLEAIAL